MGLFNIGFFGTSEHRVFNYRPRYYDEKKEELKQKFGKVDGSMEDKENYVPGSYIRGSFRNNSKKSPEKNKLQKIVGMVSMVLVFVMLILFVKYFQTLMTALGM